MYVRNCDDIDEIIQWLRNSKFLPKNLSPDVIHLFLSSVNGDKNKAKMILSNYYYVRQSIPELFTRRDSILKKNFSGWKGSCFFPLKGKAGGHQIFLGAVLDSSLYDYQVHVKQMFMCYDLLIMSNDWDTGSRIMLFSYDNLQYQNLASFTMYLTRKATECQTKNYLPGKIKAVHNVHIQPFMKNLILSLKENLKGEDCEVVIHKSLQSLHSHINPELLPLELGGSAGALVSIAGKRFFGGAFTKELCAVNNRKYTPEPLFGNLWITVQNEQWFQIIKLHKNFFIEEEMNRIQETKGFRN